MSKNLSKTSPYLKEAQESIIEEKGQSHTDRTNKHNSVLRSFSRPQADGKLKKKDSDDSWYRKLTWNVNKWSMMTENVIKIQIIFVISGFTVFFTNSIDLMKYFERNWEGRLILRKANLHFLDSLEIPSPNDHLKRFFFSSLVRWTHYIRWYARKYRYVPVGWRDYARCGKLRTLVSRGRMVVVFLTKGEEK